MEPNRKFDLSWISSKKATQKRQVPQPNAPAEADELRLLRAFAADPNKPLHVVDLARAAEIDFEPAVRASVRLAGRNLVEIVKRDTVAEDHLLRVTPLGLKALE